MLHCFELLALTLFFFFFSDAKKGSAKTSDEKTCFSSMKNNQMCKEKAKSENVFSGFNDSSSIKLVFKKDSKSGNFVLHPASSSTVIVSGDQKAVITTSASTSTSSSHENTKLKKTKVVPSSADAVSSKKTAPTLSTEEFNQLSTFATAVETILADLNATKGSKVSTSKAPALKTPAPELPDTTSASNAALKTLLATQASKVSPSKVSAATAIVSNLALEASAAASPKLASVSEPLTTVLADIKIAMAASISGSSNTAPSTSSSSSSSATAAASSSSSSSAKADPVKKLPFTKTVSKTAAAAARRKQKAYEKSKSSIFPTFCERINH